MEQKKESAQAPLLEVMLRNLGTVNKNRVTLRTKKGHVVLYFSYETLVAVDGVVSENDWSTTTGKLLNELEPNKKARVSHEEVLTQANKRISAILEVALK